MIDIRKIRPYATGILIACVVSACIPGCIGFRLWEKGKYFKTDRKEDFDQRGFSKVGIYVFSDGAPRDGKNDPFDAADVISSIISLPVTLMGGGSPVQSTGGVSKGYFPGPIKASSEFEPDTSNTGPSLELAAAVKKQLDDRGYKSEVVSDMPHSGTVTVESCLKDARDKGFDAAFIVNYTGLKSWTKYAGTTTEYVGRRTITRTNVQVFEGYLYLPSAAIFDVRKNDEVWQTSYYGIVEHAHTFNFSSEPFTEVVSDVVIANGADTFVAAAPLAAQSLLTPKYWPESYKEVPEKDGKTKHL